MSDLLAQAQELIAAGVSVLPIKTDGTKGPAIPSWKHLQDEIVDEKTLDGWFGNGDRCGLGIIGGEASRDLEILDFDDPGAAENYGELIRQEGRTELVERLPLVRTPTGGFHLYYRCSTIEGNLKLARKIGPDGGPGDILIETRGEGGYVLAPGSPVECHELKKPYELIRGDLADIPTITPEERDFLLNTARSLNEYFKPAKQPPASSPSVGNGDRPGDRFNARAAWREVLEPHGWVVDHQRGEMTHWRRPGKKNGASGTTNHEGRDLFHCFTSNGHPFEAGDSYEKFTAFTLLNHGGGF